MTLKTLKMTAFALALSTAALPAFAETITFAFTDDDPNYVATMEKLVDQFEAENKDITVDFVTAGYAQMMEQLPLQLSVGKGPDVAKITANDLLRYTADLRPYMKDPDGFAKLHGASLDLIRTPGSASDKIGGYVASQTLNQPFVNVTLFEQAGVPLPAKGATLTEIVDASVKVAKATGVEVPFTMDRSGHRFAGPAFSYGAHFLKDGQLIFPDDGAKRYIADFYKWTQSGAFPKEMWGAAGGTRYKSMGDEFANGNVVTYLAGNWMINPFITKIGDAFDWTAIDPPCGDGGCVPMPGGDLHRRFSAYQSARSRGETDRVSRIGKGPAGYRRAVPDPHRSPDRQSAIQDRQCQRQILDGGFRSQCRQCSRRSPHHRKNTGCQRGLWLDRPAYEPVDRRRTVA